MNSPTSPLATPFAHYSTLSAFSACQKVRAAFSASLRRNGQLCENTILHARKTKAPFLLCASEALNIYIKATSYLASVTLATSGIHICAYRSSN